MTDVEWMFADAATGLLGFAALANLNPLRWSGSRTFPQAVADLQQVMEKGNRPIVVKIPSGISTPEKRFDKPQAAIDFIKSRDPVHIAELASVENEARRKEILKKDYEDKVAAIAEFEAIVTKSTGAVCAAQGKLDEALKASGQSAQDTCEWMFGDVGLEGHGLGGWLGTKLTRMNPTRWSQKMPYSKAKEELQVLVQHSQEKNETQRKVNLKQSDGTIKEFADTQSAIEFLANELKVEPSPEVIELQDSLETEKHHLEDATQKLQEAKNLAATAEQTARDAGALD